MQEKRDLYPRGLLQPKSGFRFSLDALLLACYPQIGKKEQILDLGCGCGVIGFGIYLLHEDKKLQVTGLELIPEMVEYARENARMLGLDCVYCVFNLDIRNMRRSESIAPESFDRVVLNPPYRKENEGRISPKQEKNVACFERDTGLEDFLQAAAYALKNKGRINVVYPANSQSYLLELMLKHKLEPKRMCFVHSRSSDAAIFLLLEAVKNAGKGVAVQPPLFLYSAEQNLYSRQALQFCPFLKCNSGKR